MSDQGFGFRWNDPNSSSYYSLAAYHQQLHSKFYYIEVQVTSSMKREWHIFHGQLGDLNWCTVSDRDRQPIGHYHAVMEATCLLMPLTVHLKMALTILILDASKLNLICICIQIWKPRPWREIWQHTQYSCLGNPMDSEKPDGLQSPGVSSQAWLSN